MTTTVQPVVEAAVTPATTSPDAPVPYFVTEAGDRAAASTRRLVPATIGRPGHTQVVWISCPTWCSQDHLADREVALEDIDHYSASTGWDVGSILTPDEAVHELYVRVHSDPMHELPALREAHVLLGNGSPFDSYLTPEMAETAADELIALATQVRDAARIARLGNLASAEVTT
jgi:hypothetical protein